MVSNLSEPQKKTRKPTENHDKNGTCNGKQHGREKKVRKTANNLSEPRKHSTGTGLDGMPISFFS